MTTAEAGVAAGQLLATKLHAPRRRREVVRRPRLTDRFVLAHQPALTLVSAPAGFGKTTLLTEWFGNASEPTRSAAWLALDAGDNDSTVFGAYIVAALRSIAPQVGATAESLLQASQPLHVAAATLINDLELLDRDVALVLDDYHAIGSTDVHEAISFLVEHAPPRFHLVLATRADPPLPLARWRARGDLLEIRATDLRFTVPEAASYFNDAMDLQLSAAEVGALEARTEGWIAALQLAALSLRDRDDIGAFIDNFTGDDRFVLDYLAEEVLERQPDDVRRFLLQTAVLNRLSGSLCDAVTGGSGGKATLETLDRANLFLVALDDRRHWYRYHHLFADVLRARLVDEQPEQIGELHLRASHWYERDGDTAEAVRHAIAGQHFDRAAQLIELAAPMMRRVRQEATLRGWLEALPDGLFDARPVLIIALVGARMATGDPTGVERLLDDADRWLDASIPPPRDGSPIVFDQDEFGRLPAQIAVYRAALALLSGDTDGTIAHATHVLALTDASDHFRLGAAAALLGLAYWSLGDLDEARRRYADAVDCFVRAGFIADVLGCSLALADIQIAQGHLRDARRTYESALELASGPVALRGAADMHVGLSELRLESNDLDDAARHLHIASELGEHAGLPQHPYRWRAATAHLRQAQGDLAGALELLVEAEAVYNTDFSPAVRPIVAVKARVQLALGDVASAVRWAADRGVATDDDLTYVREYEHITLARTLLAQSARRPRHHDDTLQFLGRLLAAAERGHREGSVIEILVLQSLGHEARGDRPAAMAALEQALVRAEPEGYVRVFLEAGPGVPALLRSTRFTADAARHADRVLAVSGANATELPARSGLVEELSSRELDVLRLLRSDLSGPEIARELHVSLNTIRTHTKRIYTKLGATTRREAIRRATDHGL
jgi:LuxR family transcriptional regulator, maltose regulon positive regulatory protein